MSDATEKYRSLINDQRKQKSTFTFNINVVSIQVNKVLIAFVEGT